MFKRRNASEIDRKIKTTNKTLPVIKTVMPEASKCFSFYPYKSTEFVYFNQLIMKCVCLIFNQKSTLNPFCSLTSMK